MHRTFRYPLRPTAAQAATLETWRIACQQLYNGALQERRDAWRRANVVISRFDQFASLKVLRHSDQEWWAMAVEPQRSALQRVDHAFKAFFRRCKAGEKPGYPRFKNRDRYNSFGIGRAKAENGTVFVPKLGPVRFHEYRPLRGQILNVELKREGAKWFVCFACDLGAAPPKTTEGKVVGIDLGLAHFATLSNGDAIEAPRFFRESETRLAVAQRVLGRRKRGSKRRQVARRTVVAMHRKIRNRRLDFVRKTAARLVAGHALIAHEDLAIRRMVHGNLAKSIHDAAWGIFIRALTLKAESAGRWCIAVNPRGTSQRCSGCGAVVKKELSERTHGCGCGLVLDRDHNAALNVLALGFKQHAEALGSAETARNLQR